jgi:hypothetical protein
VDTIPAKTSNTSQLNIMKALAKSKTPFVSPGRFAWNEVPVGGLPTRERCWAVAMEAERQAAVKLVQEYRSQEKIAAANDIGGRQQNLDRPFGRKASRLRCLDVK